MANVLDYIDWRGDLSFKASPINEIDKYIFACIGKPDYTGIIPADSSTISLKAAVDGYFAANPDEDKLGVIASAMTLPMLKKIAVSPRYSSVRLSGFINKVSVENTEQFSAVTVHVGDINYIAFRGTDDSIVGWKENCQLAVKDTVPAQRDALDYLKWAAKAYESPMIVCGHSKGGNLAIYAASNAPEEVQNRILEVYGYDSPGFNVDLLNSDGYKRIQSRITTVVPDKSIVGMLLNQAGRLDVVQAKEAGVVGHDGLTWDVTREAFIRADDLSDMSKVFRASIAETLAGMDTEGRGELVEEIFDVLTSTGAFTLTEFSEQNMRQSLETANNFVKAGEIRSFIFKLIEESLKQARATNTTRREVRKEERAVKAEARAEAKALRAEEKAAAAEQKAEENEENELFSDIEAAAKAAGEAIRNALKETAESI